MGSGQVSGELSSIAQFEMASDRPPKKPIQVLMDPIDIKEKKLNKKDAKG